VGSTATVSLPMMGKTDVEVTRRSTLKHPHTT
jgi:hypothetical protein